MCLDILILIHHEYNGPALNSSQVKQPVNPPNRCTGYARVFSPKYYEADAGACELVLIVLL
jgi:hypothetical protein